MTKRTPPLSRLATRAPRSPSPAAAAPACSATCAPAWHPLAPPLSAQAFTPMPECRIFLQGVWMGGGESLCGGGKGRALVHMCGGVS